MFLKSGAATERKAIRWLTTIKATKWQYTNGVLDTSLVSPDNWTMDQALLDRPGNADIQLALFYDYRTNIPLYHEWQVYFRKHQPPTLVVWGKSDVILSLLVLLTISVIYQGLKFICLILAISLWKRTVMK
jgi:hypothetical protein